MSDFNPFQSPSATTRSAGEVGGRDARVLATYKRFRRDRWRAALGAAVLVLVIAKMAADASPTMVEGLRKLPWHALTLGGYATALLTYAATQWFSWRPGLRITAAMAVALLVPAAVACSGPGGLVTTARILGIPLLGLSLWSAWQYIQYEQMARRLDALSLPLTADPEAVREAMENCAAGGSSSVTSR